jgi:hypothetical protein
MVITSICYHNTSFLDAQPHMRLQLFGLYDMIEKIEKGARTDETLLEYFTCCDAGYVYGGRRVCRRTAPRP